METFKLIVREYGLDVSLVLLLTTLSVTGFHQPLWVAFCIALFTVGIANLFLGKVK